VERAAERNHRQHAERDRHPQQLEGRPPILERQPDQPDGHQQASEYQEGPGGTDFGDQDKHRREVADNAAQRGNGVQVTGGAASLFDFGEGQADREGRNASQQRDRHGEQDEHARERSGGHSGVVIPKCGGRHAQDGARHQRHQAAEKGRPGDDPIERRVVGRTVGPAPADEIAERQVDQDQADDIGPDDVAGPEGAAQQTRGRQLNGQCGHAAGEHGEIQETLLESWARNTAAHVSILVRTSHRTRVCTPAR